MNIGDTITVKVDPDQNGGFDTAPAIVTGVYDDGALRIRVLGATGGDDTVRNYVGDDGEPFDYEADHQAAAAPTTTTAAAAPGVVGAPQQPAQAPTVADLEQLSPEQRAQLLSELQQLDAQPPTTDGTPGAGA